MPSFVETGQQVPEKKIFEEFLPYKGMAAILVMGHVTWIIYIHIGSPFLKMLHITFCFDWPSGFRDDV